MDIRRMDRFTSSTADFEVDDAEIKGTFRSAFDLLFGKGGTYSRPVGVNQYVISPKSSGYWWWLVFIRILSLYSSFLTPLQFGFFRGLPPKWNIQEIMTQVVFLVDSILQFFVAYREERTYKLVYNQRSIALRYIKSGFIPDILGCVPWDALYKSTGRREWVRYLLWVRLYRAKRIHKFFGNMEKDVRINYLFTRITKLIMVELYCTHTAACIFYYLATLVPRSREGYTWIGSLSLGDYSYHDFRDIGLWRKYITSLYFAIVTMATVGYGDIHAVSISEMIFIMIYISFDMILGAYLIGNMTALIVRGRKTELFRDKMTDIMKFMNRNKIERDLQTEIKDHQRLEYETQTNQANLLQDIPLSIRAKVAQRLYREKIENVKLFEGCSLDFINQVVIKFHEEFFLPGDVVVEQGQAVDQFYIVSHGTLEEVVISEGGSEETVGQLDAYDTFGEIAILCKIPQPHTVRVLELSSLLRLEKEDFANILQLYFTDGRHILKNLLKGKDGSFRNNQLESDIAQLITKQESEFALRLNNAAYYGDLKYVKNLVRAEADPSKGDYNGRTALHMAASGGSEEIVNFLLKDGANPNETDKFGNSPLLEAVKSGHNKVATLLMNAGAVLNLQDSGNYLCKAVADGQTELLKRLLACRADPNSKNHDNRTPLHLAASEGLHLTAKILLDYGASVLSKDRWENTPLDEAHRCGSKVLIQMLENTMQSSSGHPQSSIEADGNWDSEATVNDDNSTTQIKLHGEGTTENSCRVRSTTQANVFGGGKWNSIVKQKKRRCIVFPYHPQLKMENRRHGVVRWVPRTLDQLFDELATHFGFYGTCLLTEDEGKILDPDMIRDNEKLYVVKETTIGNMF